MIVNTRNAMASVPAASLAKFAPFAASAISEPSPTVWNVWLPNVTYSETMLAFHAPPVAVISPVIRYGKMAGRISVRQRRQPLT